MLPPRCPSWASISPSPSFNLRSPMRNWRIVERQRLTRTQFERWFANRAVGLVVMEACGQRAPLGALAQRPGHRGPAAAGAVRARLRQAQQDRCSRCRRAAGGGALRRHRPGAREIARRSRPSRRLHRTRSLWMATRTSRINALRGFCREFGIAIALGARTGLEQIARVLAEPNSAIPELVRPTMKLLVEEIRLLEARVGQLERELTQSARASAACTTLLTIPGVGLLTATAMVAATSGNVSHFRDARHFAAWFGLTPKEHSSGSTRRIGRISKRGDRYLRMLLTHGARSVLRAASAATQAGGAVDSLRAWALAVQGRTNHNKATCALANKLARICYACLRDSSPYGQVKRLEKKIARSAYPIPA